MAVLRRRLEARAGRQFVALYREIELGRTVIGGLSGLLLGLSEGDGRLRDFTRARL
jgi:hypothetical protein